MLAFDRFSFAWLVSTLGMAIILAVAALIWGPTSTLVPRAAQRPASTSARASSLAADPRDRSRVAMAVAFELLRTRTLSASSAWRSRPTPRWRRRSAPTPRGRRRRLRLGGLLAGIAGVLVGPITFANPYLGDTYGIDGFVALMIGGIERPAAAMGGGLILGCLGQVANTVSTPQAADWFPFVVVVAVLLLTPDGLFRSGAC